MKISTTLGLKAFVKSSMILLINGSGLVEVPGTRVGLFTCGVGVGVGNRGLVIKLFGRTEVVGDGVGVGVIDPPPPLETGVAWGVPLVADDSSPAPVVFLALNLI